MRSVITFSGKLLISTRPRTARTFFRVVNITWVGTKISGLMNEPIYICAYRGWLGSTVPVGVFALSGVQVIFVDSIDTKTIIKVFGSWI